jgi:tryptophan halogenase
MSPAPGGGDTRPPVDTGKLFTRSSYEAVMYGMDFLGEECRERYGSGLPRTPVQQRILDRVRGAPYKLPKHDAWLQQVVGMPKYPTTAS